MLCNEKSRLTHYPTPNTLYYPMAISTIQWLTQYTISGITWVTRPDRLKGAKDTVKLAQMAASSELGPGGQLNFYQNIFSKCERGFHKQWKMWWIAIGTGQVIVRLGMCRWKYLLVVGLGAISNAGSAASDNSAWANLALIEQSAEQSDHCRLIIATLKTHFLLFHCTPESAKPLSDWCGQKIWKSRHGCFPNSKMAANSISEYHKGKELYPQNGYLFVKSQKCPPPPFLEFFIALFSCPSFVNMR